MILQARPVGSCQLSCGMPSGHSSFSIGFFVLMFLDVAQRVNPMDIAGGATTRWWRLCCKREVQWLRNPLANPVAISGRGLVVATFQWGLILLPVPVSRIALRDHSLTQVDGLTMAPRNHSPKGSPKEYFLVGKMPQSQS